MAAPVTVEAVARHAGVSRQTVSNAINAPERLRPETLKRVLSAIEALGYRPNRVARSLRTQSTRMLGYRMEPVKENVSSPVLDRFLHSLTDTAREAGYHLLLFAAHDEADELAAYDELIRTNAVDAFVFAGTHHEDPRHSWFAERGAKAVSFGRPWGQSRVEAWVDVDGAAGTSAAVQHLVGLGHRRIAFLGSPPDRAVGDDRFAGWQSAMESYGLGTSGLLLRGPDTPETGAKLAGELLQATDRPTAIVCSSDTLAMGCYRRAKELGLTIGQDLAVVGFDDSPTAAFLDPALSSVRQPLERVGREIVRLLTTILAGGGAGGAGGALELTVLLPPTLTVRESSAYPNSAV
jgi:DNA-binding LacI/PurR family transcriptional regulator